MKKVMIAILLLFSYYSAQAETAILPSESYCVVDINHNGELDSGEMFTCQPGETTNETAGYICSIDQTQCELKACPTETLYYDNNTCYLSAKCVDVNGTLAYPTLCLQYPETYHWTCENGTLTDENPLRLPYPTCTIEGNATNYVCPLGDKYSCIKPDGRNSYYCSPNGCIAGTTLSSTEGSTDTPEGINDKTNDGTIDSSGNCTGNVYIFNGKDMRCRLSGIETVWSNCCSDYTYLLGLVSCTSNEIKLAALKDVGERDGRCHEVGSYCSWKISLPFGGSICMQKKKTYCCFKSVLAKVIQEQGRQQLGISWGTPENPNCRGFTPREFQKLNFSEMDLSEWFDDLENQLEQAVTEFSQNATQQMTDYLNTVTK